MGSVRNIPEAIGRKKLLQYKCAPGFAWKMFVHVYARSKC